MVTKLLRTHLYFIILAAVSFFLYLPTLQVGFLSDDYHALFIAREIPNLFSFFHTNIIGTNVGSSYGPLWSWLMGIQYLAFGLSPVGYHVVSVFGHIAMTILVMKIARLLHFSQARAFLAALFFALLPNHVETVTWIAAQVHLFAALFYLTALYWYLAFLSHGDKKQYLCSIFFLFLSLFTKDIAITALPLFFVAELFFSIKKGEHRPSPFSFVKQVVWRLSPVLLLSGLYLVLRAYATGTLFGYYANASLSPVWQDIWLMWNDLFASFFFSQPIRGTLSIWFSSHIFVWVLIVFSLGAILFFHHKKRELLFLGASYLIVFVPFSFVSFSAVTDEGERYGYLLSAFFSLFLFLIIKPKNRYSSRRLAIPALLFLFALFSSQQIGNKIFEWQDATRMSRSILDDAAEIVRQHPDQPLIFVGLPDSFFGAQLIRNGIGEALSLHYDIDLPEGSARPVAFTRVDSLFVPQAFIFTQIDDQRAEIRPADGGRSVTGFPVHDIGVLKTEIEHFALPRHDGSAIVLTKGESLGEDEKIAIIYYTEGRLVFERF